jgi:hypothetical protein
MAGQDPRGRTAGNARLNRGTHFFVQRRKKIGRTAKRNRRGPRAWRRGTGRPELCARSPLANRSSPSRRRQSRAVGGISLQVLRCN